MLNPSLTMETLDPGQWLAQDISGFFRAPYTGSYRLYFDYVGMLKLSLSLGNMSMSNKTEIRFVNSTK
jgi:hypothetical protein